MHEILKILVLTIAGNMVLHINHSVNKTVSLKHFIFVWFYFAVTVCSKIGFYEEKNRGLEEE